ncbi:MAG: pirin family protein [Xanthomonadales bacterium]
MSPAANTARAIVATTPGVPASDGAGVRMTRIIGSPQLDMLDPFLLLDCFESDRPEDYIGGFPSHPHRGFETVTYLLAGRMRHKDNAGNEGVIEPGGVQWMTAGRGIVHSEMPEQEDGLLRGFQLWVNLPARAKMTAPGYQEFAPEGVPLEQHEDGTRIRVVAGTTAAGTVGAVRNDWVQPLYLDVTLPANGAFEQPVDTGATAFLFVIDGAVAVGNRRLERRLLGVFGPGDRITVTAGEGGARFLLVAAQPLNEPVARGGPFVMNTRDEVLQAFDDFRNNRF